MLSFATLSVFLGLVLLAATTGSIFKPGVWYAALDKPAWTPPNWMFPIVWAVLYIMIAVAGWYVWEAIKFGLLMWLWVAQLVLNTLWSYLFFGRNNMGLAFLDIVLLMGVIIGFIMLAIVIVPTAGFLFMPYLAWVMLAAALNFSIWQRNKPEARQL